jgi:hypothetical protein
MHQFPIKRATYSSYKSSEGINFMTALELQFKQKKEERTIYFMQSNNLLYNIRVSLNCGTMENGEFNNRCINIF